MALLRPTSPERCLPGQSRSLVARPAGQGLRQLFQFIPSFWSSSSPFLCVCVCALFFFVCPVLSHRRNPRLDDSQQGCSRAPVASPVQTGQEQRSEDSYNTAVFPFLFFCSHCQGSTAPAQPGRRERGRGGAGTVPIGGASPSNPSLPSASWCPLPCPALPCPALPCPALALVRCAGARAAPVGFESVLSASASAALLFSTIVLPPSAADHCALHGMAYGMACRLHVPLPACRYTAWRLPVSWEPSTRSEHAVPYFFPRRRPGLESLRPYFLTLRS